MSSDSTTQLKLVLNRLRNGDPDAAKEMVDRTCNRVERLTRKLFKKDRLHRFVDTGDVLQDASLRLWKRLEHLKGSELDVREYFHIARGEIKRALQDLARHYFGPLGSGRNTAEKRCCDDDSSEGINEPVDQGTDLIHLDQWTEFHRQVAMLPDLDREVFENRWYLGFSNQEIADLLDMSRATVDRHWLSARISLNQVLDEGLLKE